LKKIILLLFCGIMELSAHTIIFKDLKVVYGVVSSQDGKYIYFQSDTGKKQIRKDLVGKIIIQDIKDDTTLKKFLKKVRDTYPNYVPPSPSEPPPSKTIEDVEYESAKILISEIEEEEKILALKEKSRTAMTNSFLFPGWGQSTLGNSKWGIFYGSTFLLVMGAAIAQEVATRNAYSQYKSLVSEGKQFAYLYNPEMDTTKSAEYFLWNYERETNSYTSFEEKARIRNQLVAGSVGLYLLSILHTYIEVRSIQQERQGNVKVGFSIFPSKRVPENPERSLPLDAYFSIQIKW
jgi:hypothetical protein